MQYDYDYNGGVVGGGYRDDATAVVASPTSYTNRPAVLYWKPNGEQYVARLAG